MRTVDLEVWFDGGLVVTLTVPQQMRLNNVARSAAAIARNTLIQTAKTVRPLEIWTRTGQPVWFGR